MAKGRKTNMAKLESALAKAADSTGLAWQLELTAGSEFCWSITLRITPHPNDDDSTGAAPDVSTVLMLAGLDGPEEAAADMLPHALKLLASRPAPTAR